MDTATPSAGPAPVTFTPERFKELIAEAHRIARDPGALILPTREHVQAQHAALMNALTGRAEATRIVIAILLDQGQRTATIPDEILADVAASGYGLVWNRDTKGYTQIAVTAPPQAPGRPM